MIDASEEESLSTLDEEERNGCAVEGDVQQQSAEACPVNNTNKGRKLTNEQIVALAVGFMLAGYETTANTLAYTSYLLALNPEVQEKLQSEIDSYFDEKPVSWMIKCIITLQVAVI